MELKDYWIGDQVIIKDTKRRGVFRGIKAKKARVEIAGKILLIPESRLDLYTENKSTVHDEIHEEKSSKKHLVLEKVNFNSSIDLHIEKLQPSMKREHAIAIRDYQLRKLRQFLDKATSLCIPKVTIVHGKGTGALKMEVYHMLEDYPDKACVYPIHGDGAVEVYFRY